LKGPIDEQHEFERASASPAAERLEVDPPELEEQLPHELDPPLCDPAGGLSKVVVCDRTLAPACRAAAVEDLPEDGERGRRNGPGRQLRERDAVQKPIGECG
jgi:hypothetical protein